MRRPQETPLDTLESLAQLDLGHHPAVFSVSKHMRHPVWAAGWEVRSTIFEEMEDEDETPIRRAD
jgi:hypothetical protein